MLRLTSVHKNNDAQFYYVTAITIVGLYFAFALVFDHLQIHSYRHDSAYNSAAFLDLFFLSCY